MATATAIAFIRDTAQNRIDQAGPALAAALGIEWPTVSDIYRRDTELKEAYKLQHLADFLSAALTAVQALSAAEAAEEDEAA